MEAFLLILGTGGTTSVVAVEFALVDALFMKAAGIEGRLDPG